MSASEEFCSQFQGGGHLVITCGLCLRTHFGAPSGDYQTGEYEDLHAKAQASPNTYIEHAEDSVHSVDLGAGTPAVYNCPCDGIGRYERWVWTQRERIIAYLCARTAEDKARAETNGAALAGLESGEHQQQNDRS